MNERHDGYPGDQYELVGYDAYGQPVYREVPPERATQDGRQPYGRPYGYDDPYGTGQQPPVPPYDPQGTGQQPRVPHDPYGTGHQRPVPPHDPYGTGRQPGAAPQDPYGTGQQPPVPPHDAYGTAQQPVVPPQDAYGTGRRPTVSPHDPYGTGRQPPVAPYDPGATGRQPIVPPAPPRSQDPYGTGVHPARAPYGGQPHDRDSYDPYGPATDTGSQQPPVQPPRERGPDAGGHGGPGPDGEYRTEQFSFVEEPTEDSEDVIDWLKFTESRTERREEARRRARSRVIALVVVLALVLAGGVGYLWYAGKLPSLSGSDAKGAAQEAGPQNRDVIVVHLHNTKGGGTSTALLVNNTTTQHGTTILLPNSLGLTDDDGTSTTLAKSVDDDGSSGTRDSIDTLLGTRIEGTWRLDTPYLNNLVELVGNIDITTDANVPDPNPKKGQKGTTAPLVKKGEDQTLSGPMAVAYATYRAPGEPETAQLDRFGQVMQGVLRKMSSDPQSSTVTVQTLAQIMDPSLTDKDLGAFLAKLADHAKGGDYKTMVLPVQQDGTVSEQATDSVVKDVLGGTVKAPAKDAAVRVGVKNASGAKAATESSRVALVNGGYTFIDAGANAPVQTSSQVTYADAAKKQDASEVAKTLGLPASAVRKGDVAANADVSVTLGEDYHSEQGSTSP
ncbi:LCP family protein [Streptomyces sp. TS71-3]|uniref:LCP family protein n=1 Tax=Streptomyces sp. TS71-3 TaxID=2733862 RepID=UPI001B18EFD5|nr:LCP family protein [Streptomyces sp. TS71-3]GHJ37645.1 membrane protein [Streptomyces sp. TS71-3]